MFCPPACAILNLFDHLGSLQVHPASGNLARRQKGNWTTKLSFQTKKKGLNQNTWHFGKEITAKRRIYCSSLPLSLPLSLSLSFYLSLSLSLSLSSQFISHKVYPCLHYYQLSNIPYVCLSFYSHTQFNNFQRSFDMFTPSHLALLYAFEISTISLPLSLNYSFHLFYL